MEGVNSISVIDPRFCAPYVLDLTIDRKPLSRDSKFIVTQVNGNFLFKAKKSHLRLHDHRILIDAAGNHVVTLRAKIMSAHNRWEVYKGNGSSNPIFSVKTSHVVQLKTKLQVFMARNVAEEICDFRVEGSWTESSCIVYAGETSTIIAQMRKKHSVEGLVLGKDKFMLTVYPNVDYAFIVALIVILDEINH